ncbi:hypothetical protein J6590_069996 [Homalodisca vitripennis]|nr:hypothetical protein J6590_069996 [Homalodisca vitripennis]
MDGWLHQYWHNTRGQSGRKSTARGGRAESSSRRCCGSVLWTGRDCYEADRKSKERTLTELDVNASERITKRETKT